MNRILFCKWRRFYVIFSAICLLIPAEVFSQVVIQVDAALDRKNISPWIYGKNNSLSDNPSNPLSADKWQLLREAGLRMLREGGGNNSTKYNWRLKLSSHPDWYNNVYFHDWDYTAKTLQQNLPDTQGLLSFQLIGKAAGTGSFNFGDWSYNQSKGWSGVNQNLAGGGTVNPSGGNKALKEGDPSLYLMNWPADSTVAILDHWFGKNGIGIDQNKFIYWNMDNEPEIWSGTHDDVMPVQLPAEEFMQRYFEVAKTARQKYPGIKLTGPVPANEWQWYNWNGAKINYGSKDYVWLEYFIKRIGEEQKATGIKLLDVLDIHFYPGETNPADLVQLHRVYFDKNYVYPGANGVKRSGTGGWDNSITKEYIFERCSQWLENYIGPNHGVTFGVTETDVSSTDPNVVAAWYASTLGEFMKQNVDIFTPWAWKIGMWEVLHLYSRYNWEISVRSVSGEEESVSAYSSVSLNADSMTIVLVNRSLTLTKEVSVNISNFPLANSEFSYLRLNSLPSSETFRTHQDNALKKGKVMTNNNSFTIQLPPLSITSVLLASNYLNFRLLPKNNKLNLKIWPNPVSDQFTLQFETQNPGTAEITVFDMYGKQILSKKVVVNPSILLSEQLNMKSFGEGPYFVRIVCGNLSTTGKIIVKRKKSD